MVQRGPNHSFSYDAMGDQDAKSRKGVGRSFTGNLNHLFSRRRRLFDFQEMRKFASGISRDFQEWRRWRLSPGSLVKRCL